MIALSLALSFLGSLAFIAFLRWLYVNGDTSTMRRELESVRLVLTEEQRELHEQYQGLEALVNDCDRRLNKAAEATGTTAATTQQLLSEMSTRIRNCELKAGVVGVKRQGLEAAPDPLGFERVS